MAEEWKYIEGFEGKYKVSSLGRVYSEPRYITRSLKETQFKTFRKGGFLSLRLNSCGYTQVSLYKDGKTKPYRVHRLVALSFIPNPDNKPQVNHINGDINDNSVQNLEWCTGKENVHHSIEKLGRKRLNITPAKPILQKTLELDIVKRWESLSEAGRAGYNLNCISGCCRGKFKTHAGYVWVYA